MGHSSDMGIEARAGGVVALVGGAGLSGVATLLATGGLLAGLVSTSALAPSPASATGAKVIAVGAETSTPTSSPRSAGPMSESVPS